MKSLLKLLYTQYNTKIYMVVLELFAISKLSFELKKIMIVKLTWRKKSVFIEHEAKEAPLTYFYDPE